MIPEADDAIRAIEEWERILKNNGPEDTLYNVLLTNRTMEFLGLNIIHRKDDSKKYTDEQREILGTIWARFEAQEVVYAAGKIDFSFNEVSFIGKILKESVDAAMGLRGGDGFCRDAADAFLELNRRFVMSGGKDNPQLTMGFEQIRKRIAQ